MIAEIRRCGACRQEKPTSMFGVDKRRPLGLNCYCRPCVKAATKKRAEKLVGVVPPATKTCSRCRLDLPSSAFFRNSHGRDGLWNKCKKCAAPLRKKHKLAHSYGLTVEDHERMLRAQGGRCAVCPQVFGEDAKPCVDHDHATGKVRGLLCFACNMAIGQLGDDPRRMRACADYVEGRRDA